MVTCERSADGATLTIIPRGRFDFTLHAEFRQAYADTPRARHYIIDLGRTDYMDSSALGMLLLLREHAGGETADIRILNCTPDVRKVFAIAQFHKLFTLT